MHYNAHWRCQVGARRGTKGYNTQKYYELRAISGEKAIGLYIFTGHETT